MTKSGYRGVSLKGEVVEVFRAKAKEAGKTLSAFLEEVLESYSNDGKEVLQKGSTITKGDLDKLKEDIRAGIKEDMREVLEEVIKR